MKTNAFTLIELLIVIAIVAILAGALVPMFRTSRYDAQVAKVRADLEAIKTASHLLHFDTGQWPAGAVPNGITDGRGLVSNKDINEILIPDWNGPYLDEWKEDPWGSYYEIWDDPPNNPNGRGVLSYGPNKGCNNGGFDDIWLLITPDTSN